MKIALIKQKTGYDIAPNREQYKKKIQDTLQETKANIIVGPELSISSGHNPINYIELERFSEDISKLIKNNELIIPGTGLVYDTYNSILRNLALVLTKNEQYFFNKKSSHFEEPIAESYDLEYKTGEDNEGIFPYENLIIAIEICRDHGMGKLKNSIDIEADIEFILASGLDGIYPEKTIVNRGIIALNNGSKKINNNSQNGYAPEVSAYKKQGDKFELIEGKETEDYLLFENE